MTHRIDLPPHLTSRPFALGEALSAGVGETRLRGSDLEILFRGVRAPASPGDLIALCQAFAVRMRQAELFSHRTAVRLWGIPLSRDPTRRRSRASAWPSRGPAYPSPP